jgi:hypothetical protein
MPTVSCGCGLQRVMPQGLWRGTVPGLLLTIPYTAVQFVALQQCRGFAERHGILTDSPLLSFVSGATAGAAATISSYPFDVLRTVLAAQGRPPVRALTPCFCSTSLASGGCTSDVECCCMDRCTRG